MGVYEAAAWIQGRNALHTCVKLYRFAFYSRCFLLFAQYVLGPYIPDHESEDAYKSASCPSSPFLEGLTRWDGQYYAEITEGWYGDFNQTVFFPGMPIFMKTMKGFFVLFRLMRWNFMSNTSFAIIFQNAFLYPGTAVAVFMLARNHPQSTSRRYYAETAALLFILSPANIFFTVYYTETFFAFSTFWGLFFLQEGYLSTSMVLFHFSQGTRSNGILNIGFVIHQMMWLYASKQLSWLKALKLTSMIIIGVLPLFIFQSYVAYEFCNYLPGDPVWCQLYQDGTVKSSMPYTWIQKNHWENGFLRYWQLRKLPNFLLFAPCAYFSIIYLFQEFRIAVLHAYLQLRVMNKIIGYHNFFMAMLRHYELVYVVHLGFLVVYCLFFMHVEVGTRLIFSSTPILYMHFAHLASLPGDKVSRSFTTYSMIYTFAGLILHTNGYPWT